MKINFEIPISDKQSMNIIYRGSHWSVRSKLKDHCYKDLLPYKGKFKIKKEEFPVKVTYHFKWKTKPLDTTNATLLMKSYEDGLRAILLLPDDDIRYVRQSNSIVSKKEKGAKFDSLEITIEPFVEDKG